MKCLGARTGATLRSVCFMLFIHITSLNLPGNFTLHQFLIVTDVTYMLSVSLLLETPSPAITPFFSKLPTDMLIFPTITL